VPGNLISLPIRANADTCTDWSCWSRSAHADTETWGTSVNATTLATRVHLANTSATVYFNERCLPPYSIESTRGARHARRCSDAYEQPPGGSSHLRSTTPQLQHRFWRRLHGCTGMPSGWNHAVDGY